MSPHPLEVCLRGCADPSAENIILGFLIRQAAASSSMAGLVCLQAEQGRTCMHRDAPFQAEVQLSSPEPCLLCLRLGSHFLGATAFKALSLVWCLNGYKAHFSVEPHTGCTMSFPLVRDEETGFAHIPWLLNEAVGLPHLEVVGRTVRPSSPGAPRPSSPGVIGRKPSWAPGSHVNSPWT